MNAIISNGDYTARVQLPVERRQLAGALSYLNANHASAYEIKYNEDSDEGLTFTLECHGIVDNAIAKALPTGFRFHTLNDTIALMQNLPYLSKREFENTIKVEGLASYEQLNRMLTEAYPQSVTTKYYCPLTVWVHGRDEYGYIDEDGYEEDAAFAARHEDDAVHRDIFADVNLDRFANEIENANDNYTIEILKQLHDKFVEIYDTDSVDGLVGFIQVPAIVESLQTGDYYPALVTLDLDSSGEHWGTCVMTPTGVIDHGVTEETEAEKAFMQNLVPYRYWYTVNCESDIHVDMAECPEDIWDIISSATGQSFEQNGGMSL